MQSTLAGRFAQLFSSTCAWWVSTAAVRLTQGTCYPPAKRPFHERKSFVDGKPRRLAERREHPVAGPAVTHASMANAILRKLAMDAVEQAKSGHLGMPMGMADVATVLFSAILEIRPGRSGVA